MVQALRGKAPEQRLLPHHISVSDWWPSAQDPPAERLYLSDGNAGSREFRGVATHRSACRRASVCHGEICSPGAIRTSGAAIGGLSAIARLPRAK